MITIISGVPGSGKTALIVDMIMEEIKLGRKIYTIGIPELLLNVKKGGNPQNWHDGSWLDLDRYAPEVAMKRGLDSPWLPQFCNDNCQYLETCPKVGPRPADYGALVIVDEAQIPYPQRPSGRAPPPHIEALAVHRHQGLDFWFLSQKPSFMDPFIRGLASRHIHIGLSPFLLFGNRYKYEWPEYQESISKITKLSASRIKYKPGRHVFPLYKSATVHTKLDQRLPTIVLVFGVVVFVTVAFSLYAYSKVSGRSVEIAQPQFPQVEQQTKNLPASAVQIAQAPIASAPVPAPQYASTFPEVDSCIQSATDCRCYRQGRRAAVSQQSCKLLLEVDGVTPSRDQQQDNYYLPAVAKDRRT